MINRHSSDAARIHREDPPQPALYVVPDRQVARADHVPSGRTLHLVDVENLMRGPLRGEAALAQAVALYKAAASVRDTDHVIIGANPGLGLMAKLLWGTSRLVTGKGPNGADRALIKAVADVPWTAARYDQLVIGSGDGVFEFIASEYTSMGLAVGVVSLRGSLSWALANSATFVRLLPDPPVEVST